MKLGGRFLVENSKYKKTQKTFGQILGSLLLIVILLCSGLFVITPPNMIFTLAIEVPSSTEKIDNDFSNGTFNNTEIYIMGNDAVLRINSSISESNNWIEKKLHIKPVERFAHAMATIWGTDKVLLYGGANFTLPFTHYDDTWIYDYSENTWKELEPLGNPPETSFHEMAPIHGTQKVLLFATHHLYLKNNTWIYDLKNNSWTEKTSLPFNHSYNKGAMAPISGTDKVLLFGQVMKLTKPGSLT